MPASPRFRGPRPVLIRYTEMMRTTLRCLLVLAVVLTGACGGPWNDPYPASERGKNIYYTSFVDRPKTLDPARSYTSDEWDFLAQVYEPPLQYHYLKRPYELVPLTVEEMPRVRYYDAAGVELDERAAAESIAYTDYEIHIRRGILFQPHPAFARDDTGKPVYLGLSPEEVKRHRELSDFARTGTRELTAEDYVYQIKRLALPRLNSPILGHLSEYIVGLKERWEEH